MNNILLNENDNAKLSDYGLSIISEETDKSMVGLPLKNLVGPAIFIFIFDVLMIYICSWFVFCRQTKATSHGKISFY